MGIWSLKVSALCGLCNEKRGTYYETDAICAVHKLNKNVIMSIVMSIMNPSNTILKSYCNIFSIMGMAAANDYFGNKPFI